MEYTNNIGANIARLRREKGAKQDELASYVGVSAQAVSKWENGGLPDTELLPKIADFFGVSVDALFGRNTKVGTMQRELGTQIAEMINSEDGEQMKKAFEICVLLYAALTNNNEPEEYEVEAGEKIIHSTEIDKSFSKMFISNDSAYYLLMLASKDKDEIFGGANYSALFADLSDEKFFTALCYLENRQSKSDFTANLFAKQLGFSANESAAVIEKLKKYSLLHSTTVEMDDAEVEMYRFGMSQSFRALLTFAKELPQGKNE